MLRNIAYVWNERYQNSMHEGTVLLLCFKCIIFNSNSIVQEDPKDQTKRRLSLKYLMKDHLIIVEMFKLTESCFGGVMRSFYTVQVPCPYFTVF